MYNFSYVLLLIYTHILYSFARDAMVKSYYTRSAVTGATQLKVILLELNRRGRFMNTALSSLDNHLVQSQHCHDM